MNEKKNLKDGDKCPKCGNSLDEGVRSGYVVCLECNFEQVLDDDMEESGKE
jgi:uncharacterized Zn finger protein (UPF0148 family)